MTNKDNFLAVIAVILILFAAYLFYNNFANKPYIYHEEFTVDIPDGYSYWSDNECEKEAYNKLSPMMEELDYECSIKQVRIFQPTSAICDCYAIN